MQLGTQSSTLAASNLTIKHSGQFSGFDALQFKTRLAELLDTSTTHVLIDLSEVHSIDLAGINVLIWANRCLQSQRRTMSVKVNPTPQIQWWIHMTKLDRILPMEITQA
jgi:anti-anti-sigma factor